MRERPSRRVPAALAVLLLGLVTGCASIPESGPVQALPKRAALGDAVGRPDFRLLPPEPQPGESARDILDGFLVAMADFSDDHHSVAREYLAPDIRDSWDSEASTTVYDRLSVAAAPQNAFVVNLTEVAVIGRDDGYTPATPHESAVKLHFGLSRVAGQWRLSDVPPGLAISAANADRALRAVDVYFVAAGQRILVPDHVFLPATSASLPRVMLAQLVSGPTLWLAPAVRPVVPSGTTLLGVQVDGTGTLTVNLGSAAAGLSGNALQDLEASLAFTMGQLRPLVTRVHLLLDGRSTGEPFGSESFASYDPDGLPSSARAYFVDAGHLAATSSAEPPAPLVLPSIAGVRHPAVLGTRLAAIRPGGTGSAGSAGMSLVVTADITARQQWRTLLRASRLTPPTWSAATNRVWTVATDQHGGQRLLMVAVEGKPVEVPLVTGSDLAFGQITAFQLARDGARAALVADGKIYVGRVHGRGALTVVDGLRDVSQELTGAVAVAWADADTLAVLASRGTGAVAAWQVVSDGSRVTATGPGLEAPVEIAAAPEQPWIASDGRQLWTQRGGGWQKSRRAGYDPSYPD